MSATKNLLKILMSNPPIRLWIHTEAHRFSYHVLEDIFVLSLVAQKLK